MKLIVSRNILENVDGVGKAEVMITLKSSKESVLNKDLSEEKQTEEERSGETQKVNKNQKKQEETILSDSSGNSAPYVIKELEPEISGIVISCEGAGNKVFCLRVFLFRHLFHCFRSSLNLHNQHSILQLECQFCQATDPIFDCGNG